MSLVRVRFLADHGDYTTDDELRVDPASAASLSARGIASIVPEAGEAPTELTPMGDDEATTVTLPDNPEADDIDPDTGDVTLQIPD